MTRNANTPLCRTQSFSKNDGYCSTGSANKPPKAGPTKSPSDRIPTTKPIARRSKRSSPCEYSVTNVLATEIIPDASPRHVRHAMAALKLELVPNKSEHVPVNTIVTTSVRIRP